MDEIPPVLANVLTPKTLAELTALNTDGQIENETKQIDIEAAPKCIQIKLSSDAVTAKPLFTALKEYIGCEFPELYCGECMIYSASGTYSGFVMNVELKTVASLKSNNAQFIQEISEG